MEILIKSFDSPRDSENVFYVSSVEPFFTHVFIHEAMCLIFFDMY